MANDSFYKTKEWQRIRWKRLQLDRWLCTFCQADLKKVSPFVNHKKPRKTHPELSLDINNLESVCRKCHDTVCRHQDRHGLHATTETGGTTDQDDPWFGY